MKTKRNQQGMGILAMLAIAVMVGFFVMSGIRITPGYVEYLSVREMVIRIAGEFDQEEDTISDIRRDLATDFNTSQIKGTTYQAVDISRKDGRVIINANYEQRIPLVWRIDAVVKYDDLVFVAGEDYSE
ncbi:MAG: DUF4845 domain-containing protein [Congregibacter sp.]